MFLAVGVLMTVVIPKLMTLFEGQALPASTQTLINVSEFFQSYWIVMILAVIIGIAMLKIYHNTRNGAYILDSIMLEIPLGLPWLNHSRSPRLQSVMNVTSREFS